MDADGCDDDESNGTKSSKRETQSSASSSQSFGSTSANFPATMPSDYSDCGLFIGGNEKVIVEAIAGSIDSEAMAATIEATLSQPGVVRPPTKPFDPDNDEVAIAARKLKEKFFPEEEQPEKPQPQLKSALSKGPRKDGKRSVQFDISSLISPGRDRKEWKATCREAKRLRKMTRNDGNAEKGRAEKKNVELDTSPSAAKSRKRKASNVDDHDQSLDSPRSNVRQDSGSQNTDEMDSSQDKPSVVVDKVRCDVRKEFWDVLVSRVKAANDVLLSNDEVKSIALRLEQCVFKFSKDDCHGKTYKRQVRDIQFQLGSSSNEGLFRRLLLGKLSCEQLASLSRRQMTLKKYSSMPFEKRLGTTAAKCAKTTPNGGGDGLLELFQKDTTTMHKSHVFDISCKICTGKQPEAGELGSLLRKRPKLSYVRDDKDIGTSTAPLPTGRPFQRDDIMVSLPVANSLDPLNLNSISSDPISDPVSNWNDGSSSSGHSTKTSAEISFQRQTSSISFSPYHASVSNYETATNQLVPSPVWSGLLHDEKRFRFTAELLHVAGGSAYLLKTDLPPVLQIDGRIAPQPMYQYLAEIQTLRPKDVVVLHVPEPVILEDWKRWARFYDDMVLKKQMAVVNTRAAPTIKDFFLLALSPNEVPNTALLLFEDGPGLPLPRRKMILAVVVLRRRHHPGPTSGTNEIDGKKPDEFGSQFPDFENSLGEPGRDLDLDTAAFENARILFNGWETTDLMDLMKKNV